MRDPRSPARILRSAVLEAKRKPTEGLRNLEKRLGLKKWSLRGLMDSDKPQTPSVEKAAEICRALGLELYIGPPRGPADAVNDAPKRPNAPTGASTPRDSDPVSDRRLEAILAAFAEEWDASDEHGRAALETRFRAYFPEMVKGARK